MGEINYDFLITSEAGAKKLFRALQYARSFATVIEQDMSGAS